MTTAIGENLLLRAALEYAGYGWRVVPLVGRGKAPRVKEWQKVATVEEEIIVEWWSRWPTANLGVQLGSKSGIVDIECDSAGAEQDYLKLWKGDPPVTPTFSGARGKHRLFQSRDDLPATAVLHIGRIEVRLGGGEKGAQSVFPPSIHPSGKRYEWLVPPSEVEPPPLPNEILARIWNLAGESGIEENLEAKTLEYWEHVIEGVSEGERNQKATELCGYVLRCCDSHNNQQVATQWLMIQSWNCKNRPPLDEKELRRTFESVLRRERIRKTNEEARPDIEAQIQRNPETGALVKTDWRLVIITSEPPRYKIFSPLWEGPVEVDSGQYVSPTKLKRATVDQKNIWLPKSFRRLWEGTKDKPPLARILLDNATKEEDAEEASRPFAIAEQLYSALTNYPRILQEGEEIDSRGIPCLMQDGSYVFQFSQVWRPMSRSEDKVKRHELTALLRSLGAVSEHPRIAGVQQRRTKVKADGFESLKGMLGL